MRGVPLADPCHHARGARGGGRGDAPFAPVVAVGVKGAVGCAADRADRLLDAIRRAAGVCSIAEFSEFSVTSQFAFSQSCQWWVVSCLQAADQLCPVALTVSVFVLPQTVQVKVFTPAVVQVAGVVIFPSSH